MKIEDWFQWPTKSTDPAVNAAIAVLLSMVVLVALAAGAVFLIPIAIILAVAKGVHWYVSRPIPTAQLLAQAEQQAVAANFPDTSKFLDAHMERFIEAIDDEYPVYPLFLAMMNVSTALYEAESLNNPLPPMAPADAIAEGRYRDRLITHQRKTIDAPRTLELFSGTLEKIHMDLMAKLPPIALTTGEEFSKTDEAECFATLPLIDVLPNAADLVWPMVLTFFEGGVLERLDLFSELRKRLDRNVHDLSGVAYPAHEQAVTPDKFKGTPREIVAAYLGGTPLEDLFHAPIPFSFADRQRFEHMHVVGGSGHGKTQFLQHLIVSDLKRETPPALVVVDSQGEMLRKIARLDRFAPGHPLSDRLVIVDPEDVEHPPALNMFETRSQRRDAYSQAMREQVEATTIETFNYVFGALAAELTSRQNTTFAFVARLMLSIPGATVHTLLELFEDGATEIDASPFAEPIRRLDPVSQSYFRNQFFTKAYGPTRQQIARRLYGVLQVPAFDRMFASPENRLDMFEALQNGSVVLINTSKALLKSDASALFGRFMIARVISAAFERVALPAEQRNSAFLIVDEAAEYFDENLETLLSQARKYNLGVVFAHQHLDQLAPALKASVAANTSIKLAGGVSDKDARALAADMHTSPEFIASASKHSRSTEFACHVRNHTTNAVRLSIPFGAMERAPRMTEEDHRRAIERNRERYAASCDLSRPVAAGHDEGRQLDPLPDEAEWRS